MHTPSLEAFLLDLASAPGRGPVLGLLPIFPGQSGDNTTF